MFFMFSLIPATVWLIIGYFVIFAATKAEGNVRIFGRVLSIWIFVIASIIPLMGAYATLSGQHIFGQMMQHMNF